MTSVVNIKHESVHCDVYGGRPGPFGNPFVIGRDGDRAAVIEKYRAWFVNEIGRNPEFRARVEVGRGKVWGCFCKPEACHLDVIAEWLNRA